MSALLYRVWCHLISLWSGPPKAILYLPLVKVASGFQKHHLLLLFTRVVNKLGLPYMPQGCSFDFCFHSHTMTDRTDLQRPKQGRKSVSEREIFKKAFLGKCRETIKSSFSKKDPFFFYSQCAILLFYYTLSCFLPVVFSPDYSKIIYPDFLFCKYQSAYILKILNTYLLNKSVFFLIFQNWNILINFYGKTSKLAGQVN